jgi:hypothetical protein
MSGTSDEEPDRFSVDFHELPGIVVHMPSPETMV